MNVKLNNANLKFAKLDDTVFGSAKYDNRTVWPKDFDPKDRGAIIVNVDEWH